eukprot:CAMPEP_0180677262 /NCGR_PEP_ID=MMETSP1037_2-20121125/67755_1 /TAXON_ID=632150 /ORGANISM="Azadinium spinosum, Strain 3D9" /LENGTH=45 /DNA_ID= /DNA_START= /DNA_END= /DNA_ORIENTATION=
MYHQGQAFLNAIVAEAVGMVGEFWVQNLANTAWAVALLRYYDGPL